MISKELIRFDNKKAWSVSTPPAIYPIEVEEIKEFARIDGSEEDNLLASFIATATDKIEDYTGRAFINRTMIYLIDGIVSREMYLPSPPLYSVTSIVALDENDTETEYSSDNYYVVRESIPGQIIIKRNAAMPSNTDRYEYGFKITFVAGYGFNKANVPAQIKKAITELAAIYYDKRIVEEGSLPPEIIKDIRHFKVVYRDGFINQ